MQWMLNDTVKYYFWTSITDFDKHQTGLTLFSKQFIVYSSALMLFILIRIDANDTTCSIQHIQFIIHIDEVLRNVNNKQNWTHAKPFFTNYYIHGLNILKYDQWTLQWQWIRFDINICDSPLLKSRNISSIPLFSFADVWKCLAPTDAA